ncbi:uncharacterized protein N7446_007924 [Penicillium canescens]|uniref:Uncharacterized protein n=1 Tax=Penicillium canescens TaxID=5083 RepID=A0AAD6IM62_PENCN|nr:uncharacterized protein N7446_007859 [Penicillium canescens]XP_058370315.1 uncharacterized protein N7446_007924 [Penicillium canescens]KAJ6033783.1 hypothetical protein N7444_011554 [Penicillium canescens]KAJ6033850.1 hypothetical protein N7444_011621 [Penicillium canescens]KAJ6056962.1 hypothetical protein N7460_000236 [Penicillium canescens]KAJ6057024.1 hypothetical protein N7460_000298 [Penicillium canescens]KAJ6058276.1 hypothetical protein N7446_007859 [Penicillium canescens]
MAYFTTAERVPMGYDASIGIDRAHQPKGSASSTFGTEVKQHTSRQNGKVSGQSIEDRDQGYQRRREDGHKIGQNDPMTKSEQETNSWRPGTSN